MNHSVIQLNNVTKTYKIQGENRRICDGIDLTIKPGEFILLEGENGSGKTTLLNLILGLETPDSGDIRLMGKSPDNSESKLKVGTMLQRSRPVESLKVKELIELFRSYYPNPLTTEDILNRIDPKKNGLQIKLKDDAVELSGGQEQSLYFALAIAGNPDVLILDEPTRNLDRDTNQQFWEQVRDFAKQGKTILAVSHNQSDREIMGKLATRVLRIENGKLQTVEENFQSEREQIDTSSTLKDTDVPKQKKLKSFWGQFKTEWLGLIRNPFFLLGILAICCFAFLSPANEPETLKTLLVLLAVFNLLIISLNQFIIRLATERVQGWIKLLKVTPLPAGVYIAAKVAMVFCVAAASLVLTLAFGISKMADIAGFGFFVSTFISLSLGMLPFAILGVALGYILEPKSTSVATLFVILLAIFTMGIPLENISPSLQTLIAFSPFYHYGQLVAAAADIHFALPGRYTDIQDGYFFLHVMWLIWTAIGASLLAIWAYERDRVSG